MSTHLPGFQSFFRFLHHFVMTRFIATSSIIRVNVVVLNVRLAVRGTQLDGLHATPVRDAGDI